MQFDGDNKWMLDKSIAWRELYAIIVGLATFGDQMCNKYVAMYTDNQAIQACINSGVCRDTAIMALIRALYFYVTKYKIRYRSFYVSTHQNGPADSLSRNDLPRFRTLCPGAYAHPAKLPPVKLDF